MPKQGVEVLATGGRYDPLIAALSKGALFPSRYFLPPSWRSSIAFDPLLLEKKQSLPAGYVPVSAYVGSSKNLKDLKDCVSKGAFSLSLLAGGRSFLRSFRF